MGKKNLLAANSNKNDEFYTTYEDIKKELVNYAKIVNKMDNKIMLMNN